jgi:hypothetical protein
MSCKMIDWLVANEPTPACPWHYCMTASGAEPSQYVHPAVSDHAVSRILRKLRPGSSDERTRQELTHLA